ncbi:MAG: M48 family metallopeptidase [Alloprevotella sp.]
MDTYNTKSISVAKVISWMIIFLVLYLPLILLVLAFSVGCIWGLIVSAINIFEGEVLVGGVQLLAFGGISIYLVCPFCIGILRPFFVLYKSGRDNRTEITEKEAPELVNLIYRIADLTKNDRPKHIYVSASANACVFFDTRFSNIFVPVKKNIEIGLGVFKHMSVAETASCIAHEFGHFSQDTMRWGTVFQILNTIIVNMMSINERWNSMVNKLIYFPWIIGYGIIFSLACKAIGWLLYGITIGYISVMEAIYKKIQLAYLELSRKMEYEADAISARIVSSNVYVSFAGKLFEISKREDAFFSMMNKMASKNLLVNDFWNAYSRTDKYLAELSNFKINSHTMFEETINLIEDTKLIFEAVYSSHPDWKSRINAIKDANYPMTIQFEGRAWDLIPQSVQNKVAKQSLEDLSHLCNSKFPVKMISDKELTEIIESENYWYQYAPYFQREIVEFDYNECSPNASFNFGNDSVLIINRYIAAKSDYDNALALVQNNDINKAIYQGVVYKTSQLPIDIIKSIYEEQRQRVQQIDKSICEYAMLHVTDIESIKDAYRRLFYAQNYLTGFENEVTNQQKITINLLNKAVTNTNSHQYATIKDSLEELNECLRNYGIGQMDKELFDKSAPEECKKCVKEYMLHGICLFIGDSISGESINLLICTCNWIRDIHTQILSSAKMSIIDACLERLED